MPSVIERPLIDLCDAERGITYGIVKVGDFQRDGVPVIRGGDIRNGRITFDNDKRVSEEVSNQFRRTILRGGEILVNLIAEPGHSAIVPTSLVGANVSRDVAVIALGAEVDHKYVDYVLKSPQAVGWLHARLNGSVTQKINLGTLRELPVPCPSLHEQRVIARILGALDEKIELDHRTNQTLEAMTWALFKSWFVDFDPVRMKMAGRQPEGMDPNTAALFPNSFEQSNFGPVPKGWRFEPLDAVASFLNGLALQKFPAAEGGPSLPVIKIAELRRGNTVGSDRASVDVPPEYVVVNGDVLFSWSGSLTAVLWSGGRGALNQHLFKVSSSRFPRWLYFRWVLQHLPDFQAIAADKATTMGHIQRGHLTKALVAVPPPALMERARQIFEPLDTRWLAGALESRTLAQLRDSLLPRLLSGELSVAAASEM